MRPTALFAMFTATSVAALVAACGPGPESDTPHAPLRAVRPNELRAPADFASIADTEVRSQALFVEATRVMLHPRCANCHPDGNVPLQGEAGIELRLVVQRVGLLVELHRIVRRLAARWLNHERARCQRQRCCTDMAGLHRALRTAAAAAQVSRWSESGVAALVLQSPQWSAARRPPACRVVSRAAGELWNEV
jgi:hypothetical protein